MGNLGAYLRPVPAGKTKEFYLENFKDEKGEKIRLRQFDTAYAEGKRWDRKKKHCKRCF